MISKNMIVSCLILVLAFSCSEKDAQPYISKESKTAPPKITVLSNLPDSIKPVTILLKKPPRKIKAGKPIIHSFLDSSSHRAKPPEEQAMGFFTNYTSEDGLAVDALRCGFIDKNENLWFGTDGAGVSRYDGQSFTNYTTDHGLPDNFINAIVQDRKGNLWFATRSGASRFDGRSFTNYTKRDGLANNAVSSICEDKFGILWFGTGEGLSRYDGKRFVHLTTAHGLADIMVRAIAEDRSGNLWIGTAKGVSFYDGKRFTNPMQMRTDTVNSIVEDNQGNIWVGTTRGILRYNSDSVTVHFPTYHIISITKDRSGNLWIATNGYGVLQYDCKAFIRFTKANGLPNNRVRSICEDKTGNIWIATYGGGITRYGGKSFMSYGAAHGLSDYGVIGMIEDKAGDLWFGTFFGGLTRYDGKSFSTYTESQGLINDRNVVRPDVMDKEGNLWISSPGHGVSCFDGEAFTNYDQKDGLCSNRIDCMGKTKNGKIWFGSGTQGVTCYDGNSFINYSVVHGLPSNNISCITEDAEGGVWFGTIEGLSRFDGKTFANYSTANGLSSNSVYSCAMDKSGNLWFGTTGGGVSRFDGNSFINFTVGQGLPDNNVIGIVIDSAGKIFFGTNNGLAVLVHFSRPGIDSLTRPAQNDLKNDELKNYTPQFEIYNKSAGYPIKDMAMGSMIEDSKGNLWLGTDATKNGLIRFNYLSVHKDKEPAVPVLHNVKVNNEPVCWYDLMRKDTGSSSASSHIIEETTKLGFTLTNEARDSMRSQFRGIKFDSISRFYPIPENLVLPYRHNNISFDFGSVELNRPKLVRYQYILEGYDKRWSPITNKTSVAFGNIDEGTYAFKLRALNTSGIWSDPLIYTFKVLPPWYRTWWFRMAVIVSALSIVYGYIRWWLYRKFTQQLEESKKEKQLAKLRQQKAELEIQALRLQMNPHFISNSLNSINWFILQNNITQASEYLTKFSKLVRMILENSQAPSISLESELESLSLYLDLEALRFDHRFGYKISVPKDLDVEVLKVPPLFIQPYTENAIWHGLMHRKDKGQLDIEVSQEDGHLLFKIRDNGIGRKQAAALSSKAATRHKSMGLKITKDRIDMLHRSNGTETQVTINDLENADGTAAGTEVLIKIPARYD